MTVDHREANTARHVLPSCIQEGNTPVVYYIYAYDSPYHVVVVSCGDVRTESRSAGVDTVQAQGWSVVEREQAFAE